MGTRADFYVRKETKMEWLGSIGWDGYPDGIENNILQSTNEEDFRNNLNLFKAERKDFTSPEDGWPWPWDDSRTTDYAYIFENGKVMASCFGYALFDPMIKESENDEAEQEDDKKKLVDYFPDMKSIKKVQYGDKSGLIIIQAKH